MASTVRKLDDLILRDIISTKSNEPIYASDTLQALDEEAISNIILDQCDSENICDIDLEDAFLNKENNETSDKINRQIADKEDNIPSKTTIKGSDNYRPPNRRANNSIKDDDLDKQPSRVKNPVGDPGKPRTTITITNNDPPTLKVPSEKPGTSQDGSEGKKPDVIPGWTNTILVCSPPRPGSTFLDFLQVDPVCENESFFTDPLRGRTGGYWSLGKDGKTLQFLRNYDEVFDKSSLSIKRIYLINNLKPNFDLAFNFGYIEERYEIKFKERYFLNLKKEASVDLLNSYAVGGRYIGSILQCGQKVDVEYEGTIRTDTAFQDLAFKSSLPIPENDLKIDLPSGAIVSRIKPDYNFYIKLYENLLKETNIQEYELPNLYSLVVNINYKNPSPNVSKIFNMDGNIEGIDAKNLSFEKAIEKDDDVGQYFDEFSIAYPKVSDTFKKNHLEKQKNIYLTSYDLKNITTFNKKKFVFPMFIDLKVTTNKLFKFGTILKNADLLEKVCLKLTDKIVRNEMQSAAFIKQISSDIEQADNIENVENLLANNLVQQRYIDLSILMEEALSSQTEMIDLNTILPIGEFEDFESTDSENIFSQQIKNAIFKDKVAKFLNMNFRTYKDIMKGKTAYNEILMYRVAKYRGTNTTAEPIQNIFFANDPDMDAMEYVDTQVKYDQLYTYVVYAYKLMITNSYTYSNVTDSEVSEFVKNVTIRNTPSIRIMEIEYFRQEARVYDSPPPPPEFDIVSYRQNDKNVLLLMNSSANTYMDNPVLILPEDEAIFRKATEKQNIENFGEKIEFSSDDRIAAYQIFRMTTKPKRYSDFANSLLAIVNTDVFQDSLQEASSAAFLDTISPNRKYYYMFRSVDIHDKPSNPTEVMEIEMINENGTVFMLTNVLNLKEKPKRKYRKSIKRFLQIKPSSLQTRIDYDTIKMRSAGSAEKAIQTLNLGEKNNSIWGKKYRIRVVSRNSKKHMDIDFSFDFLREKQNKNGK